MNTLNLLDKIKNYYLLNEDEKVRKKFSNNIVINYLKVTDETKQNRYFDLIKKQIEKEKEKGNLDTKEAYDLLEQLRKTKDRIEREKEKGNLETKEENHILNQIETNSDGISIKNLVSSLTKAFNKVANNNKNNNEDKDEESLQRIKIYFNRLIKFYKNWKKRYNDKGDFSSFLEKLRSYDGKKIKAKSGNGEELLTVDISEKFVKMIK